MSQTSIEPVDRDNGKPDNLNDMSYERSPSPGKIGKQRRKKKRGNKKKSQLRLEDTDQSIQQNQQGTQEYETQEDD